MKKYKPIERLYLGLFCAATCSQTFMIVYDPQQYTHSYWILFVCLGWIMRKNKVERPSIMICAVAGTLMGLKVMMELSVVECILASVVFGLAYDAKSRFLKYE